MTLHLLHISITPITDESRLRITSDLTQVEYVLSQSLSLVHASFDTLCTCHDFKGFKKLMYMDLADISQGIPTESIYAVNHVLRRSVIGMPMQLCGWSELEYVTWMDSQNQAVVKDLIRKCCDDYLAKLDQAGVKETCLEHPTIRKLLLDWDPLV